MIKLYVAWYIPDYYGITILGIFDSYEKAKSVATDYGLKHHYSRDYFGVDEYLLNEDLSYELH